MATHSDEDIDKVISVFADLVDSPLGAPTQGTKLPG